MTDWNSIRDAQAQITAWADWQFPGRTPVGTLLKLYGELGEVAASPASPHEVADVFILLIDYCSLQGIDLPQALKEKMAINRGRRWRFNSTTGLAQHIEEDTDAES